MVERIITLLGELSESNPTQSFAIFWGGTGRFTGSTGWFCLTQQWAAAVHRSIPSGPEKREREILPDKAMCDYPEV